MKSGELVLAPEGNAVKDTRPEKQVFTRESE
jgi:hypothetical protein